MPDDELMAGIPWQGRLMACAEQQIFVRHCHSGDPAQVQNPLPALLIHGINDWGDSLLPLAQALGSDVSCTIPDLRGHGFSSRPGAYRLVDYSEDMAAVLATMEQPVILYGHSLGGLIALHLASRFPQHCRACILEDPPLFHLTRSLSERPMIQQAFAEGQRLLHSHREPAALLGALAAAYPERPLTDLRRRAQRLLRDDPRIWDPLLADELCQGATILSAAPPSCPLLILAADPERGAAIQANDGDDLMRWAPHTIIETITGAAHNIRQSHLPSVATRVRELCIDPCA